MTRHCVSRILNYVFSMSLPTIICSVYIQEITDVFLCIYLERTSLVIQTLLHLSLLSHPHHGPDQDQQLAVAAGFKGSL